MKCFPLARDAGVDESEECLRIAVVARAKRTLSEFPMWWEFMGNAQIAHQLTAICAVRLGRVVMLEGDRGRTSLLARFVETKKV